DVVVIGPGLGSAAETVALVHALVEKVDAPLVIDADGLNAMASAVDTLRRARRGVVLTPHPGEMSRLTGLPTADGRRQRVRVAGDLAQRTGAVVALKGAGTIVAAPDGRWTVNLSGGPILGTGGTGDVLSGVIGSLVGQGLAPYDAARLGVYLHG